MRQQRPPFAYRLTVFGLLCLFMVGCVQQEQPDTVVQPTTCPRKLKIGLVPEQDIFVQKKRYEPLLTHLSKEIGIPIEIKILPNYSNVVSDFNTLNLDGAIFGNSTGAMAIKQLGVEPLVRPKDMDGASTCTGIVFVKKGSGIRTARDMREKRMVFVDKATTAGYLFPLAYFRSIGIKDYEKWFGEVFFSGTYEDAVYAVLNGNADIGAVKSTIFYMMAETEPRILNELEILMTSPQIPSNALAVRSDMSSDLKQALKQQLLTMHQSVDGRAILDDLKVGQFTEATVEDFKPALEYAVSCGIDLNSHTCQTN